MNFIDAIAAEMLASESRQRRSGGGGVYLHQVTEEANGVLRRGGDAAEIGADRIFDRDREATGAIVACLDCNVCAAGRMGR